MIVKHCDPALPTTDSFIQNYLPEARWKAWTARKEREAGGEPVSVNVILPFRDLKQLAVSLDLTDSLIPAVRESVLAGIMFVLPLIVFQILWFDRVFGYLGF